MIIRSRSVAALWRVLLSRNRRVLASVCTVVAVLVALELLRHGFRADALLAWTLGGSGMLAFAPSIGMVREKADGSLRFLAFLPIHGWEHAAARTLTALTMSLPTGLLLAFGLPILIPQAPLVVALGAGIAVWLALAALSLMFTALQLGSAIGRGMIVAVYTFAGFAILAQLASAASDRTWFRTIVAAFATPAGLALSSTVMWAAIISVIVYALRRIARESPRYRGEPAEQ